MMASRLNKHFILISGSIFIVIAFYSYYQTSHQRLMQQQKYGTKKSMYFQENNLTLINLLESIKSFLQSQASDYNQDRVLEDDPSELSPDDLADLSPAARLPRPETVPVSTNTEECLPYFKDLHVKPVSENDCHHPYVLINDGGRLGNKLCQYASLYLLRHIYGVRVALKRAMKSYLDRILKNVSLPAKESECFTSKTRRLRYQDVYMKLYTAASQVRDNATDKELLTVPLLKESYYVHDYPAPRALFMNHRDLVRSLIRFKDEVLSQAIEHINAAIAPFNATYHQRDFNIVTVHVRRTDYTSYIKEKFNLTQLDELYFKRAIQFYKERLNRVVFLVVSDDATWCKQNLQARDVVVAASTKPAVDMAAISLGDHHITSYGTFSFTGALLGRGHITHPIGHNKRYNTVDCVRSPFFHHISRDETYEVDNSHVTLT